MHIRTLKDIPEIQGKRVLLRVDYNVPLDQNGKIQDDTRIKESLQTINFLLEKGAKLIIISHLGRPNGEYKDELRLTNVAKHLSKLINRPVKKYDTVIGKEIVQGSKSLRNGAIMMLENIRCESGEEKCDQDFTKKLAELGDLFVNDAFGTAHRKHSSTTGLADFLTAYAGFLMEKEINALSPILEHDPKRPLTMIFGGAKIDDKIPIVKNYLHKADYFLIGGALANTFLSAEGYNVAASLYEKDKIALARKIIMESAESKDKFILPEDVVVTKEISENSKTDNVLIDQVVGNMKIIDIGKSTVEKFKNIIKKSGTVIWNGPLGLYEYTPFQRGTREVAKFIASQKQCISILGGGDTIDCINRFKINPKNFTHVSTGGGACIEFLSGKKLPGIEVLKK